MATPRAIAEELGATSLKLDESVIERLDSATGP